MITLVYHENGNDNTKDGDTNCWKALFDIKVKRTSAS
jgi:hypothetical protein